MGGRERERKRVDTLGGREKESKQVMEQRLCIRYVIPYQLLFYYVYMYSMISLI